MNISLTEEDGFALHPPPGPHANGGTHLQHLLRLSWLTGLYLRSS